MSIISGIVGGLTSSEVLALIGRNEPGGTAGLYDCKTILNEHRPVCTKEYHLVGNHLDANNPDVWFPIPGNGGGTVVYANRFLTLTTGTGIGSATRCVIDQTKFPINGNFIEVTCRIGAIVDGEGGSRFISIGFQPSFGIFATSNTDRAIFYYENGSWRIGVRSLNNPRVSSLSLGRDLAAGDICTVRLGRQEGSPDIDIARFYVNGQKVYESLDIPIVDCYAGVGVYSGSATTTAMSFSTDYFGVKFVP